MRTHVFCSHGSKTLMFSQLNLICLCFVRLFQEKLKVCKIMEHDKTLVFSQLNLDFCSELYDFSNFSAKVLAVLANPASQAISQLANQPAS